MYSCSLQRSVITKLELVQTLRGWKFKINVDHSLIFKHVLERVVIL